MISFENISKSYGGQVLFENAGFKINGKERIGLIGRNGHGKTTLLRMIINDDEIDQGNIIIPKNYRIGYVKQHLTFTEDTVLKEGILGLREEESDQHWKVEKILAGLGFSKSDMQKNPLDFSGGFQVRLNLAKVLTNEPDLLLLDEPTNYLDITSVRWIKQFLLAWQNELILITHDRNFMDKIVTHIVGIHRQTVRKIPGDTGKYYTQIALDEEIHEKTRINDDKKRKEIELFVSRFRAKARLASMVQSRVKALSRMEKKDKLDTVSDLEFTFRSSPFKGKQVLQAENLNFGYTSDKPLVKDVNLTIDPNDRVCVIGKNGKGKTTLLKILGGIIEPDTGKVILNPGVERGVYEQTNVISLNAENTVVDELCYCHPDVDNQQARNICGSMMFEGDSALKKIKVLSGGEKSRVMLGKLLVTPLNLILLDEPTNHLDMQSCDSLLSAIDNFDGSVVMVTHNEMYLHAIAKKLIVFKDDKIFMFNGTYAEFLEKEGWGDEKIIPQTKEESVGRLPKKEYKRLRSDIVKRRSTALKPLNKGIEDAENKIEKNEELLEVANTELLTASENQDAAKIQEYSKMIHKLQEEIDFLFDKLEELSDKQSVESEIYTIELEELEKRA